MGNSPDISIVTAEELQRLWDENRVSEKRAAGAFLERVSWHSPARDPRMAGAWSAYVRLYTPDGFHIGTLHEVLYREDGRPAGHSHPKDYTLRDCSRVRTLHKQELEAQPRRRRQRQEAYTIQVPDKKHDDIR